VDGCGASFAAGSTTISTAPLSGYCTLTATFALNQYTVSTSGGNVTFNPTERTGILHGTSTVFTVTPVASHTISGVSGCSGNWDATGGIFTTGIVTANCTVTATTAIKTFTVTATQGSNGSISPSAVQTVNYDGSVTYSITPDTGYHITDVKVDGSSVGAVSSHVISNIKVNRTITATFAINTYSVTPAVVGDSGGLITPSAIQNVEYGKTATFTLAPSDGYKVDSVISSCGGTRNPADTFTTGSVTTACTVAVTFTLKTVPTLTWNSPATITYGTALSATHLNATSGGINGTFSYTPASGAVLNAGAHELSVTFTPTDTTNYTTATKTVSLVVGKATPVIIWNSPANITYGTALGATQLNANTNVAGSFTYSPVAGTVLNPGIQALSATFTLTDALNYNIPQPAGVFVTVVVAKIEGTGTYASVQDAYTAAQNVFNNDTDKKPVVIKLVAGVIDNTLIANLPIQVVLEGGYNSDYSTIVDVTTLQVSTAGRMELKDGRVYFRNIRLK
jgi:hypothetical protein